MGERRRPLGGEKGAGPGEDVTAGAGDRHRGMTNILNPPVWKAADSFSYELDNRFAATACNLGDTGTHEVGHVRAAAQLLKL